MRFNSVKRGNFSGLARSVNRNADAIFKAARDTAVDNTAIAKEAIKGRSMERRAAMEAEGKVAQAGLKAFANLKDTKNKIESADKINDIKRPAKRMAGVVAGLGAISQAAVMNKNLKDDKRERAEMRELDQQNFDTQMEMLRGEREASKALFEKYKNSINSTENDTTIPDTNKSEPTNSGSTPVSTPVSTPAAPTSSSTSQPKIQAKVSPDFKGMVDMATRAGAKYPQLVAAQWALESGWGRSPSGTNNYFGIKATSGESSTSKQTWEVYDGKEVTTSANFKNYASPQGSVNDLVSKWHKDYKSYKGVNNASDAFSAADMLRQQGYATDPAYSEKLKKIMRDQGY